MKLFLSLFALTFAQPVLPMQEELNALLLGVRPDVVDLGYIEHLLSQGAQVQARDGAGNTALMRFAKRSWWPECKLLITHSQFYPTAPTQKIDTDSYEHMPLSTLRTLIVNATNKENIIEKLTQHKITQLKPLIQETSGLSRDQHIQALLDPTKLEQNFKQEIKANILKELGLENDSWISGCSIQ